MFASARLPRVPSWQRAAMGEEGKRDADDSPRGPGGEPPEDCVEFQLRFGLKPTAKNFDIKRFFGNVKPLIQFAQAALPPGALELVSEPDIQMPMYTAGCLSPLPDQTQRCLVLGIRLSPAAFSSRSLLDPVEQVAESLSVDAGLGLDISFAELAELATLLLGKRAGGVTALESLTKCLLLALGRSGVLLSPQVEQLLRENHEDHNVDNNPSSLCRELRRQLQLLRAEDGLERLRLLQVAPEKLATAIQVMDRSLDKVASSLVSVMVAAPRREARLEVHLGGVAYQDLQQLL